MGFNASSVSSDYTRFRSRIQSSYLDWKDANIHFRIGQETVPGHRIAISPYLQYENEISENNGIIEINLGTRISVGSFKEFLKFIYFFEPRNLTMDNIEDIMEMAIRWNLKDAIVECKMFLKNSIETSTCLGYQLVIRHGANDLKAMFEDEICVNPVEKFQSDGFLTLPHELVAKIIENDSLACREIEVFNACMSWAKSACLRNQLNPTNMEHVRGQLNGLQYHIRFGSMTPTEVAQCIGSHLQLFAEKEMQEIMCMIGHIESFKPKQFNWTTRYFNLHTKKELVCSRLSCSNHDQSIYEVQQEEVTEITCNRRVELYGIELELLRYRLVERNITIQIIERHLEGAMYQRYNDTLTVRFDASRLRPYNTQRGEAFYTAYIPLNTCIILRPKYTYEVRINFHNQSIVSLKRRSGKRKVRVDHDLVFKFTDTGLVSALQFRRLKNRYLLSKILHNPTFWVWILVLMTIICISAVLYVSPTALSVAKNVFFILLFFCVLWLGCMCIC